MFTKAIVRPPSANFADGLTSVDLGQPNYELALAQHEAYCQVLEECGLELTRLAADEKFPDSTFVEDTAVLTDSGVILTRPGALSRLGEVGVIEAVLRREFDRICRITEPGTVDGGDVCEAGDVSEGGDVCEGGDICEAGDIGKGGNYFIGISRRTNEAGAEQLAGFLEEFGYRTTLIDIRGLSNILHLKSGLAYLGGNRLLAIDELRDFRELSGYNLIGIDKTEAYAANCLLINGRVLIASGFSGLQLQLERLGCEISVLDMSEFQKMDGGLSCLSLRF